MDRKEQLTMYKSSPQTFIFKYIFPVLFFTGGILSFIILHNFGDESLANFAKSAGISFVWIAIFVAQLPFNLKSIVVDKEGIKLPMESGEKLIPFKDVQSISKLDLYCPWLVTIKYMDSAKKEIQRMAFMPNAKYQRFMKEDEMTAYIMEQAKKQNHSYQESSTLKNLLILCVVGLPFFVASLYFLFKSEMYSF